MRIWKIFSFSAILLILIISISYYFYFKSKIIKKDYKFINFYIGSKINIKGKIITSEYYKNNKYLFVLDPDDFKGNILVISRYKTNLFYKDKVLINCILEKNKYLTSKKILAICIAPKILEVKKYNGYNLKFRILKLRDKFSKKIDEFLKYPENTFLKALILGIRYEVPYSIQKKFAYSGIFHILAISGLHLSIIIGILNRLFPYFYIPKKIGFLIISIFLIFFIILTGARSSIIRASIMLWMVYFGFIIGKIPKMLNILLLPALIITFLNPLALIYDIGFQLSFLATFGILYFSSIFEKYFEKIKIPKFINSIISPTFSALIMTSPLIAYYFRYFPLFSPITNILVLPLLPILIFISVLNLGISFISINLSQKIGFLIKFMIDWILLVTDKISKFKFSYVEIQNFNLITLIGIYILIFLGFFYFLKAKKIDL